SDEDDGDADGGDVPNQRADHGDAKRVERHVRNASPEIHATSDLGRALAVPGARCNPHGRQEERESLAEIAERPFQSTGDAREWRDNPRPRPARPPVAAAPGLR